MKRLLVFALLIMSLPAVWAGDWPRFRGPAGDGISAETGINKDWKARPPKTRWKAELTDNGYGGFCIAEGKLFVIDHADKKEGRNGKQDIVRALNAETGAEQWRFAYDETAQWNWGFARSTPTYDGGRLYTLSRQGKLHCLDAKDGKPLWKVDFMADLKGEAPRFKFVASPVVMGDKLIVVPGGKEGNIAALDKLSGKVLWRGGNNETPGYVTPMLVTLDGKEQILYSSGLVDSGKIDLKPGELPPGGGHLVSVDPANGSVLWSWEWTTTNGNNIADPVILGKDKVFFASGDKFGCRVLQIKGTKPEEIWTSEEMQPIFNTPVLYKGHLYGTGVPVVFGKDRGALICMDPKTGKSLWRQEGFENGPVMIVDGVLLALDGKSGELAMIAPDPAGYKELGRITPLGDRSWTPMAVAGGRLYIRNMKTLVCMDLK